MNSKTGKLLVLGSLGGRLALTVLSFLLSLLNINLGLLGNLVSFALSLAIIAGFAIVFLSDRDMLDLVIIAGFGASFVSGIIFALFPNMSSIIYRMIDLVYLAGIFAWSLKLFKKSNTVAAIAAVGSLACSFGGTLLKSLLARLGPNNTLLTLVSILVSLATTAALAVAAFLDYQSE